MATSSIFTNIIIDNPEDAEAFVETLEQAEAIAETLPPVKSNCRVISSAEELKKLWGDGESMIWIGSNK